MSPSSAVAPPPASAADDVSEALQVLRSYCNSSNLVITSEVWMSSKPEASGGFANVHTGYHKRLLDWFAECFIYAVTFGTVPGKREKVAVKFIRAGPTAPKQEPLRAKDIRRLRQEIAVWRRLDHPNVQKLIGVLWLDDVPIPAMVSKWEPNGNLCSYLFPPEPQPTKPPTKVPPRVQNLTLVQKLTLLQEILGGLIYLHGKDIIHADLKGENVLISSEGKPLLCDFGIAWTSVKISVSFTTKRPGQGTYQYMAPELLPERVNTSPYTHASDIWAFGCLATLVLGDVQPYSNKSQLTSLIAALWSKEFFPRPDGMDTSHWALVLFCCSFAVNKRASSDLVCCQLRVLQLLLREDLPPRAQTFRDEYRSTLKDAIDAAENEYKSVQTELASADDLQDAIDAAENEHKSVQTKPASGDVASTGRADGRQDKQVARKLTQDERARLAELAEKHRDTIVENMKQATTRLTEKLKEHSLCHLL